MAVPFPANQRRSLVAGDTHANLAWSVALCERAVREGASVIVQLGDFGFWEHRPIGVRFLDGLEAEVASRGLVWLWLDGNHENHERLLAYPVRDDGVRPVRDHLLHLPRGHRWEWAGVRFCALGGAGSIDRDHRTPGVSWWAAEAVSDDDIRRIIAEGPCDILLTHDVPRGLEPRPPHDTEWFEATPDVVAYCRSQREQLARVFDALRPLLLVHGHWHVTNERVGTHPEGTPWRVAGLACDGVAGSCAVLDLPALDLRVLRWP